ncbi:MAG: alpha/beta hydrolase [Bacteroidota bacterium]
MPLDPEAKALLAAIAAAGEPSIDTIPLDAARAQVENGYAGMKIPVLPVGLIKNTSFTGSGGEIAVRIYIPEGEGLFPVIIFFHGGGWVFFHLDAYDPVCTHICAAAGCIVVSVEYRLSPEYKFPAATNDCLEASRWIAEHCIEWKGDASLIFLAGDSAGGNLAAVTAIRIRDESGPAIKGQVLIYPATVYYAPEKPSYTEFSDGYNLTKDALKWFWEKYLVSNEDARNPKASPLLAPDLSGLPPALVIVSGYDPLKDEGIDYAKRLAEAGVSVQMSLYEEMIHGFLSYLGILHQAKTAIDEISRWIKQRV